MTSIISIEYLVYTFYKTYNTGHFRKRYIPAAGYSQSKLAQVLFTVQLENELRRANLPVQVHAIDPGLVNTDIFKNTWFGRFIPSFILKLYKVRTLYNY